MGIKKSTPTPKAKIVTKDYGDAGRKQMTNAIKGTPKRSAAPKPKSKLTPQDKAYGQFLKKNKNDVTKAKGWNSRKVQ